MKQVCMQCAFAAVLLAVVVPVVGNRAAVANRNAESALQMPTVVADGFPTPWPKKPSVAEVPIVVADGFPTPWPKKPPFVLG